MLVFDDKVDRQYTQEMHTIFCVCDTYKQDVNDGLMCMGGGTRGGRKWGRRRRGGWFGI